MKSILLSRNYLTCVDDEDYDNLIRYKWYVGGHPKLYVKSQKCLIDNGTLYMHRYLLGLTDNQRDILGDHWNGDTFDNRKCNLRRANKNENAQNSIRYFSKYRGVAYKERLKKWTATICFEGKQNYLGLFETAEEAALAYDVKAKELHGAFAWLNFGDRPPIIVFPPPGIVNRKIVSTNSQIEFIKENYRFLSQKEMINQCGITLAQYYLILNELNLGKPNQYRNIKTGEEYLDIDEVKERLGIQTTTGEIRKKINRGTINIEKLY